MCSPPFLDVYHPIYYCTNLNIYVIIRQFQKERKEGEKIMEMYELLKAIDHLSEEELKDVIEYAKLTIELLKICKAENKTAN